MRQALTALGISGLLTEPCGLPPYPMKHTPNVILSLALAMAGSLVNVSAEISRDEIPGFEETPPKFFGLGSLKIPKAALPLLPEGSRNVGLGGGCVLGSNVRMDGWWESKGKETGFDTGADSTNMMFLRAFEITHFMIEMAPVATSDEPPHLAEFEVSLGMEGHTAERLEFSPKAIWSSNPSAAFPASNAVDCLPGTGWRPEDPTKGAFAIFVLTKPIQHEISRFKTAANSHYVLHVKFTGQGEKPISGHYRATAIYSQQAAAAAQSPGYNDYFPPPAVPIAGATEAYFQQTKRTHVHRFVEIRPDETGRFRQVDHALAAATQAGVTSLHFVPRSLQGENVNRDTQKPYPPVAALIDEIQRLQAMGHTTAEENFQRVLQIAGLFQRINFADVFKQRDMRQMLERQSRADNPSAEALRTMLAEIYRIHPAPLLWLELCEQWRVWDETHLAAGQQISESELARFRFGPASSKGLRVAMELSPTAPDYRNGTSVERTFVFHNSGSATIEVRVPCEEREFSGFLWNRLVQLAPGQICRMPTTPLVISEAIHGPQLKQAAASEALETKLPITRSWSVTADGLWFANKVEHALELTTAATEYQVSFADPAKVPLASANAPGTYLLAPGINLITSRLASAEGTIANEGRIEWFTNDPKSGGKQSGLRTATVGLAAGVNSYEIIWPTGGAQLWIKEAAGVRRLDFSTGKLQEQHWNWQEQALVIAPANIKARLTPPEATPN